VNSQDAEKNSSVSPKGQSNVKKNRGAPGGNRYNRDGKSKSVRQDGAPSTDHRARNTYNKHQGDNKHYVKGQGQGKTQNPQNAENPQKYERQGTRTAAQDSNHAAHKPSAARPRQMKESGGARDNSTQSIRENTSRGANQASGEKTKTGFFKFGKGVEVSQKVQLKSIKAEESISDIKADIVRLEKEIDLELKEIQNLKLAL